MRKKTVFAVALAAFIFIAVGCGRKSDTGAGAQETPTAVEETAIADEEAGQEEASEEIDYATGFPWLDSNIDGNVTSDMEVDLKDDFYLAVNRDEIVKMEYEPGGVEMSLLSRQDIAVEENMMKLITEEGENSHELELLKTYYCLLDDWEMREPLVRERIARGLEEIESLETIKDYGDAVRDWAKDNLLTDLTQISLDLASDDSSVWIASCYGPSLLLGDAAEYGERTANGQLNYELYKEIYEYANEQLGFDTDKAAAEFDRLIEFEAKIAEHTMTAAENMRAEAVAETDNYMTLDEVDALLGDAYDLKGILEYNHFVPNRIKVPEPEQLRFIGELLRDESNLEDIKNCSKVMLLLSNASALSRESMIRVQEIMAEKMGISEIQEYEKKLLSQVKSKLSIPMQIAYAQRYATAEMKEEIASLCKEIAAEYREMLLEEDWISEETRKEALRKLDTLTICSLYPDKWEDYSGLDITGMNLYEAELAIANYELDITRSCLNNKVDEELWDMDITMANAYYHPNYNSINILLGVVGDGMYSSDMSKEEVYGKIGAIISHEISHAFDSTGGQYDAEGNLVSWWTEEDLEEFNSRIEKVRVYYDQISIYGDKKLNGASLDGEATADIAGVQCLLRLAGREEDFDYDKMFRAFAELWCGKYVPYVAEYWYIYDTHPPYYLRTNVTLQQFDEFFETYDIQEGDGMYLAPEDRITIW